MYLIAFTLVDVIVKRTQLHYGARWWKVPVVNVVSRGVDAPAGHRGVGDLCRLGDQMLNIPPSQLRTGARHMKQNIMKRAIPSVRVLHRAKPQRNHFNSVWHSEKNPAGNSPWTGWLFYGANGTPPGTHVIFTVMLGHNGKTPVTRWRLRNSTFKKAYVLLMVSLKYCRSSKEYFNESAQRVESRKRLLF